MGRESTIGHMVRHAILQAGGTVRFMSGYFPLPMRLRNGREGVARMIATTGGECRACAVPYFASIRFSWRMT
jgi:hypothetical protein